MKKILTLIMLTGASLLTNTAFAVDCSGLATWSNSTTYTGASAPVKYQNVKYKAKWWTQGQNPAQNSSQWAVWINQGTCDGGGSSSGGTSSGGTSSGGTSSGGTSSGGTSSGGSGGSGGSCPQYSAGTSYSAGQVVQNVGNNYTCNIAGWCSSSAAWAYAPGTGAHWQSAWSAGGTCGGSSSSSGGTSSGGTSSGGTSSGGTSSGGTSSGGSSSGGTGSSGGSNGGGSGMLAGYFAQWGIYARNYHVKNIKTSGSASRLTHIVYAFGDSRSGTNCVSGDTYADYDRFYAAGASVSGQADTWHAGALRGSFNQLRQLKAEFPNIKVVMSMGGWTWSGGFGVSAANATTFANNCYNFLHDSRWADVFDGIDIDWEYPNACGLQCDTSGPNAHGVLMQALRSRFGNEIVSAAVSADASNGGKIEASDYGAAIAPMDFVMLMTYDFFGAFNASGPTAPHSPLFSYNGIPQQGFNTHDAVEKYHNHWGVPKSKMLLGIGFYGRGWTGVTQLAPGGSATGAANGTYEAGIEDYKVLVGRSCQHGTVGGTHYAKCGSDWWGYDRPSEIAGKMNYVNQNGLGGRFFWEFSGDTSNGALIKAM